MLLVYHNFVLAKLVAVKRLFMLFGTFLSLLTVKLFVWLMKQTLLIHIIVRLHSELFSEFAHLWRLLQSIATVKTYDCLSMVM